LTSTVDPFNLAQRTASNDTEIDREALARLLIEIARNVDPDYRARFEGVPTADPRMETLRQLLVSREISELSRVTHLLDEPEQLAAAVGGVLPSAAARASHAQLGEALAPAVERAVQRSIQKSPRTLTDILYPVFLPAIRKSIGEKIDQTFQSLNETLRHIFTWHGLKWRFEAWRTGASFSEVVLKHSLVYHVEHAFLIHRNSGLLIAHVTAENATSEDPQLISSMLSAIQDFVKDSFNEKEQSGLDTIRFGDLRLWSEVGPFATLVSVIRGNPPEELHEIVRDVLLRIHEESSQALEQFDGDGSQLAGVEAQLQTCVELKLEESNDGFPWLVAAVALLFLSLAGGWFFLSWQSGQRWQAYVSRWQAYVSGLEAQPGIIVAEQQVRDGQFYIAGLRDPLAADPQSLLSGTEVDPAQVHSQWQFYQSLEPEFVLKRLTASLAPPDSVRLSIVNDRIVAEGEAPDTWIDRARAAARQLSAGGPEFDISKVRDVSPQAREAERWQAYVSRVETQPGIIVAEQKMSDGQFYIAGLRDPLAADPQALLSGTEVDPARVHSQWQFYQSLDPKFVVKRLTASLTPPKSVRLSIVQGRIVVVGEAPAGWISRAQAAAEQLSADGVVLDVSQLRELDLAELNHLREAIQTTDIFFSSGKVVPGPEQMPVLDRLADQIKEFAQNARKSGVTARFMLTGHSDATGRETANASISAARAETVRALLNKRGVALELLLVRGAGTFEPLVPENSQTGSSTNRRVSTTVNLD
jgi:outer membrane protein OmpA-like peptidoglycan-associated protein